MDLIKTLFSDRTRFAWAERKQVGAGKDPQIQARIDLLKQFEPRELHEIYLNQRHAEWKQLMDLLLKRGFPTRIIEIGTGRGGSSYFWSRLAGPDGKVVTVDIEPEAKQYVDVYNRPPSNLTCVTGSSFADATVQQVRSIMGEGPVNLLYIDGDHTYDGVKRDFETYRQFCGPDTLVVFHDVQPDAAHRGGAETASKSGEVFEFWHELRGQYESREIIAERDQDGFGLGVLEYGKPTGVPAESPAS